MQIKSSPVIPSLICPGVPLDGVQIGHVVQIVDSDASLYVNYLVQTLDGAQHCAQMDARRRRNRNALLRMALESGRPVMLIGGINSYLTSAAFSVAGYVSTEGDGSHRHH